MEEMYVYLPAADEVHENCGCIIEIGDPQEAMSRLDDMAEAAGWLQKHSLKGAPALVAAALQELDAPLFDIAFASPKDGSFDASKVQVVDEAALRRTFGISEGSFIIPGDDGSSMQIAGGANLVVGVPTPYGGWVYAGMPVKELRELVAPYAEEASSPAP